MKKGILFVAILALITVSPDAFAYTYKVFNFRNKPVKIKIRTSLVGAPKPTGIIPAGKRVTKEKVEHTPDGKKITEVTEIEPGKKMFKIGGIHAGACVSEIIVDGESKGGSRFPCQDNNIVIGSGGKMILLPGFIRERFVPRNYKLSSEFKFGDWPESKTKQRSLESESNQDPRIVRIRPARAITG